VLDGKRHDGEDSTDLGDAVLAMGQPQVVWAIATTGRWRAAAKLGGGLLELAERPVTAGGI
jgi:hypothetical protein